MAAKIECDRCKKQDFPNSYGNFPGGDTVQIGEHSFATKKDLCKSCINAFWNWIKNEVRV